MELQQYISEIITQEELDTIKPGAFNILQAPRGWGKTTFMFDERILEFSRAKKHVLYLIHNTLMRDKIAADNPDKAVILDSSDSTDAWFDYRNKKIWNPELDDDRVHVMCYQTFAALLRKEGVKWLNDIDLIIWDEFDDIHGFYKKEIQTLKKSLPNFSEERLAALLQDGKPNSIVNFVYQIKTAILDPGKIILLAISASPERAALYFSDYINYILKGQLEEKFHALETEYINDVCGAIKDGTIAPGRKYWCFTTYITDGFRIERMACTHGFNVLVLWSERNEEWKHLMTPERKEALRRIEREEDLPEEYDMVIITAAGARGFSVYDTSFQDWICDSTEYEAITQYMRARFCPARQYLLNGAKGLVDFVQKGFSADYYEWHTLEELRELIQEKPVFSKDDKCKKLLSFNAIKKEYPDLFESRKYGKARLTQYRIKPAV